MKTGRKRRKLIIQGITCLVFVCFVFLLTFINLFSKKVYFSDNENRALSPGVDSSIRNILFGTFDTDFETWFSDHFAFRDRWIEIKASLRKDLLTAENNGVYYSHDGRLIQQFLTYDEKTVEDNISYLQEFSDENNVTLNVMLVPGASTGEKGYLPFGAANVDEKELIQSIGEKLKGQNFIDLTQLMNPKDDNYFKTDHHWNHKGAKIGYDAICKNVLKKEVGTFSLAKVSDNFKGTMYSKSGAFWTKPDEIWRMDPANGLEVKVQYDDGKETSSLFEDKNLKIKDQYTYYLDGNHGYVHITTNVPNKKKAIIIKDSYSHILIPYLAAEYSELEVFDLRYYHEQVSTHLKDRTETDVYVIYGIETFCSDTNLAILW